MIKSFAAAALAALMFTPGACAPESSGGSGAGSTPREAVVFRVEVRGISGRLYTRKVQVTINTIQASGRPGSLLLGDGTLVPTPYIIPIFGAPGRVEITPLPLIAVVEVAFVYLGDGGDFLSCWVERRGAELPLSRNEKQVPTGPRGRGGQTVS